MPTIYPSLEAFDAAVNGKSLKRAEADPLGVFVEKVPGYWFDGRIQHETGKPPLPCIIEVKEKPAARALAARGGRPLTDGDTRLVEMVRDFYAAKDAPAAPPAVVAIVATLTPPAPPTKAKA